MRNGENEKIVDRCGFFGIGQKEHVIARRAKPDVAIPRIIDRPGGHLR